MYIYIYVYICQKELTQSLLLQDLDVNPSTLGLVGTSNHPGKLMPLSFIFQLFPSRLFLWRSSSNIFDSTLVKAAAI